MVGVDVVLVMRARALEVVLCRSCRVLLDWFYQFDSYRDHLLLPTVATTAWTHQLPSDYCINNISCSFLAIPVVRTHRSLSPDPVPETCVAELDASRLLRLTA